MSKVEITEELPFKSALGFCNCHAIGSRVMIGTAGRKNWQCSQACSRKATFGLNNFVAYLSNVETFYL